MRAVAAVLLPIAASTFDDDELPFSFTTPCADAANGGAVVAEVAEVASFDVFLTILPHLRRLSLSPCVNCGADEEADADFEARDDAEFGVALGKVAAEGGG